MVGRGGRGPGGNEPSGWQAPFRSTYDGLPVGDCAACVHGCAAPQVLMARRLPSRVLTNVESGRTAKWWTRPSAPMARRLQRERRPTTQSPAEPVSDSIGIVSLRRSQHAGSEC